MTPASSGQEVSEAWGVHLGKILQDELGIMLTEFACQIDITLNRPSQITGEAIHNLPKKAGWPCTPLQREPL